MMHIEFAFLFAPKSDFLAKNFESRNSRQPSIYSGNQEIQGGEYPNSWIHVTFFSTYISKHYRSQSSECVWRYTPTTMVNLWPSGSQKRCSSTFERQINDGDLTSKQSLASVDFVHLQSSIPTNLKSHND